MSSNQEQARFHPLVKKLREERKHEDEDEKQAEIPSGIGEGLKNTQVNQSSNIAFSQFESGKGHEELDSKFMQKSNGVSAESHNNPIPVDANNIDFEKFSNEPKF